MRKNLWPIEHNFLLHPQWSTGLWKLFALVSVGQCMWGKRKEGFLTWHSGNWGMLELNREVRKTQHSIIRYKDKEKYQTGNFLQGSEELCYDAHASFPHWSWQIWDTFVQKGNLTFVEVLVSSFVFKWRCWRRECMLVCSAMAPCLAFKMRYGLSTH